jgi:hypothetical protein
MKVVPDSSSAVVERSADGIAADVLRAPWDYADAETQHLTHNIHRYSGKFIPQIASRAISLLTQKGELVVDPYCGSGTMLLEAALLGRCAIGIDLNPLAVLIARTKITPIPAERLRWLHRHLANLLTERGERDLLPLFRATTKVQDGDIERDPRFHDDWYRKWFKPPVLADLIAIDLAIGSIEEKALKNVARVAFSDILRKSSNAHSGYPNVMFDKNAPDRPSPIRAFLKTLECVCEMVGSLAKIETRWADVRVVHGTAVALPLEDCSADAVVSHPPYIGSIPYAEYGILSLRWFSVDPKQLDRELTGGRRQSPAVVERFREGYGRMLAETARILRPGRHAFLMVGNPVVRGQTVDLAAMTISLAQEAGLQLVVQTERQGINRRANKMGSEHLLFFGKPRSSQASRTARA